MIATRWPRCTVAGVGDTQRAVLLLQPEESLVDVAQLADVLTEGDQVGHPRERLVEAGVQDLEAVHDRSVVPVRGGDRDDRER